jgi:hypothetical protein
MKWKVAFKTKNQTTLVLTNPKPNSNGYLKVRAIEENVDWLNSIASASSLIYVLNECKPLGRTITYIGTNKKNNNAWLSKSCPLLFFIRLSSIAS